MNEFLKGIRTPDESVEVSKKIVNSVLIFILGIGLGILAKWLDNLALDDGVWWQHLIGELDLGNIFSMFGIWLLIAVTISVYSSTAFRAALNVFLFFVGMNASYHMYTILFAGFNPRSYMMIWYGITLVSPLLAFICWYAKGKGYLSLAVNIAILAIMFLCSFSIGMWYFDRNSILDTIIFLLTILVLYDNPRKTTISILAAIVLAYVLRIFL